MPESISTAVVEPEHRLERALRRRVIGVPWVKGQTGCPGGTPRNGKQYRALYAELEADLGGQLNAVERVQLDQVVGLVILSRREKNATKRVGLANQTHRLLTALTGSVSLRQKQVLGPDLMKEYARKLRASK